MIKYLLTALLIAAPAAAAPSWIDIGKDQLTTYGPAELYVGKLAKQGDHMMTGEIHAVLDDPWQDPNGSGSFRDIYFRVLADCRDGTIAVHPSWPEGPDEASISIRDLKRPAPGGATEKLLKAYCR
ncbi:MAG TPA: hypothetical protein VE820_11500 [Sphingomicrobium sp.]|jgi:hypothetical protein|nr:hypothetical protein [Sphingomicrobium sp.]